MINYIMECMSVTVQFFIGGIFWMITIAGFCAIIYGVQYLVKGEKYEDG